MAPLWVESFEVGRGNRCQQVERQQDVCAPRNRLSERQCRYDRARLLTETCLVDRRSLDSVDLRRSKKDLADRDDAGSADAWHTQHRTLGRHYDGR